MTVEQARVQGLLPGQKRVRLRSPEPPPSVKPHDAVILAVDPAATSGFAVFERGELTTVGVAPPEALADGIAGTVHSAVERAARQRLPFVMVAETWTFGGRGQEKRAVGMMMLGLGHAWRPWKDALADPRLAPATVAPLLSPCAKRIVRVNAQTWKALVLGRMPQDKEEVVRFVRAKFPGILRVAVGDVEDQARHR
jgi:hypothetical protein